ncbi:TPA: HNH endonuclease [Escherichia coli]|nr:HNH endonuclease [Escherichia coli]
MTSQSYFNSLYIYNPKTGVILNRWNRKENTTKFKNGYIKLSLGNEQWLAHRVAWIIHFGSIPEGMEVDHINHDKADNRIDNLRIVSHSKNMKNVKLKKSNKTGFCGVHLDTVSGKFIAKVKINGVTHTVGRFHNAKDAGDAAMRFRIVNGFHKNHGIS